MATPEQQIAALTRRRERFTARVQWFGDRIAAGVRIGMQARLRIAAQMLRDKVVINLSTPVHKYKARGRQGRNAAGQFTRRGSRTRVDPASRSKPGEFPRADTTRLMKDIYFEVAENRAIVGTTLDYGLVLEVARNRSFLRRTMDEMAPDLTRILTSGTSGTASFPGDNE